MLFVPVVSGSHSSAPPNSYVIQLEIVASGLSRKEVYTIIRERDGKPAEECFNRCGKTNVQVSSSPLHVPVPYGMGLCQTSPQELRNRLAKQESSCHGNEISSLLQNISSLRVTLDHITRQ